MKLATAFLLAFATAASAQPKPPPPSSIVEGKVVLVEPPPPMPVFCGRIAMTQSFVLEIQKVKHGPRKPGRIVVEVLTCGPGPLLRQRDGEPEGMVEIDPAQLRVGSRIRVDAEDPEGKGVWFTTTDRITVTKR
jgi:hypothetical protein